MITSTYVHPKEYQCGKVIENHFSPTGTNKYVTLWFRDDSNYEYFVGSISQNDVILSTYGKYAHKRISLTQALLNERKAEIDRENRKFH